MDTEPITASSLGRTYMINADTLEHAYKNVLSDYQDWELQGKAIECILRPENMGEELGIDETSLGDDVRIILHNKDGHGRKGTIVAIITGLNTENAISHLKDQLAALRAQYPATDFGSLDVQLANVKDEDWENNWKQYYQPLPIGEKLLVVPEWLHPENPEHRVEVLLDPGMIFGTGAHASTQMCMRELERAIQGGERVLDLGSGSGILSITAILLGAAHATGVDIDPKAEDIARENAAINQIFADRFTAVTGDVIGDKAMMESLKGHYDVVLANIVADVIIPLSRVVPEFLQEDSIFICSGILNTRLPEVLDALEKNGLQILSTEQQEDWCRVTAALLET